MTISGLVITLDENIDVRQQALQQLGADARLTLGSLCGNHLPVVAQTPSSAEGEALVEGLFGCPGVTFVDVVCVDFPPEES